MQQTTHKHSSPPLARQVLLALACGEATRKARAKLARMYGADGLRVEQIIMGEAE